MRAPTVKAIVFGPDEKQTALHLAASTFYKNNFRYTFKYISEIEFCEEEG
jgi:hypothetical protein